MSQINTEIKPFQATAYHQGKFIELSEASVAGKWSVFFFYPADFTFVCPTEIIAFDRALKRFKSRNSNRRWMSRAKKESIHSR